MNKGGDIEVFLQKALAFPVGLVCGSGHRAVLSKTQNAPRP